MTVSQALVAIVIVTAFFVLAFVAFHTFLDLYRYYRGVPRLVVRDDLGTVFHKNVDTI